MGKYFTIDELTRSHVAQSEGIENRPPPEALRRLELLIARVLDPVRELFGGQITVTSGYRSPALNRRVGGKPASQHLRGEAADITTGDTRKNRALFDAIAGSDIEFDQLIDEKGYRWIHISFSPPPARNRRQVLHL